MPVKLDLTREEILCLANLMMLAELHLDELKELSREHCLQPADYVGLIQKLEKALGL